MIKFLLFTSSAILKLYLLYIKMLIIQPYILSAELSNHIKIEIKFIYWLVKLLIEPYNEDPVKYKELYNYTEVLCALTIVG